MRTCFTYIGVVLLGVLLVSCKKTLEVPSSHLVPVNEMWQAKNDARSAVFGTYGLFRAALANNNSHLVYGELRSGDFRSVSDIDLTSVIDNNLGAISTKMNSWKNWKRFYAAIGQANLCIAKLKEVHENDFRYTEEELRLDLANVRFIRAMAYFYLVRIWGDVPLILDLPGEDITQNRRVDQDSVLDFAIQEAEAIVGDVPWLYDGESREQSGLYWDNNVGFWKGRNASKAAVYSLLAHIHAWRGEYLEVEKYTKLVIDNKSLASIDWSFANTITNTVDDGVFGGASPPADLIFALTFFDEYQESSQSGHVEEWTMAEPFIDKLTPEIYVNNDTIINAFNEKDDSRFFINDVGLGDGSYFVGFGNTYPVFSKIRRITISGDHPLQKYESNIVIYRFEEIELLRAEANYFLGNIPEAIFWLNTERGQRDLNDFEGEDEEVGVAILAERRRELMGEGWRWYDLVRFNKISEYTNLTQDQVDQGALVWPLADEVLQGNGELEQNSFWKVN